MATVAAEMMLQCVFDGSLSKYEMDIEQRPYHRNCSCALHKSKGACSTACFQHRSISFPKKESWNDCSLYIEASKFSSQSSFWVTHHLEPEKIQMSLQPVDDRKLLVQGKRLRD